MKDNSEKKIHHPIGWISGGALALIAGLKSDPRISKQDIELAEAILEKKIKGKMLSPKEEELVEMLADKKTANILKILGALAAMKGVVDLLGYFKDHDVVEDI